MITPVSLSDICQVPTASMLHQLVFSIKVAVARCTQLPPSTAISSLLLEKLSGSQLHMLPHMKIVNQDLITDSSDMEYLLQTVSKMRQFVELLPPTGIVMQDLVCDAASGTARSVIFHFLYHPHAMNF